MAEAGKLHVSFHPHALERMGERGATALEVEETLLTGESFEAYGGRIGFRRAFEYNHQWHGHGYRGKVVEAIAVLEWNTWLVITVIVKHVGEARDEDNL